MSSPPAASAPRALGPKPPERGVSLCIGIDQYDHASALPGAAADARELSQVLATHDGGAPNYDPWSQGRGAEEVAAGRMGADALRHCIRDFFTQARAGRLFFYFAGHGTRIPPMLGASDLAFEGESATGGLALDELVKLVNECPAREVVVLLDCCFSGRLGDVEGPGGVWSASLREGRTLIAASRDAQGANETDGRGDFTSAFIHGLRGAASDFRGVVTALSAYSLVAGYFEGMGAADPYFGQQPELKANLAAAPILRLTHKGLTRADLDALYEYWGRQPTARIGVLDLVDEDGKAPIDELQGGQLKYRRLQRLRDAGLVTTVTTGTLWREMSAGEKGKLELTSVGAAAWALRDRWRRYPGLDPAAG